MYNLVADCFINALSKGSDFFKNKNEKLSALSTFYTLKLEQLKFYVVQGWKCVVH